MAGSSTRGGRGGKARGKPRQGIEKGNEKGNDKGLVGTKGKNKGKREAKGVVQEESTWEKGTFGGNEKGKAVVPENNDTQIRSSYDENISTVHVWYGGKFVKTHNSARYVDGECLTLSGWDIDNISSIDVGDIVKSYGYIEGEFKLWYKHPRIGLLNGCRPFNNDKDVIQFLNDVKGHNEHTFLVQHLVPLVEKPRTDIGVNDAEAVLCEVIKEGSGAGEVIKEGERVGEAVKEGERAGEAVKEGERTGEDVAVGKGIDEVVVVYERRKEDVAVGKGIDEAVVVYERRKEDVAVGKGSVDTDGEDDSDVSLDDSDYDERWDWMAFVSNYGAEEGGIEDEDEDDQDEFQPSQFADFEYEDGSSDDLDTPPGSDEDAEDVQERIKYPKFKLGPDGSEVKFQLGQTFKNSKLFRTAVREYALKYRKNLIIDKSESTRVVVKCDGECTFYCRLSKYVGDNFWKIVSLVDKHSCCRSSKNRHARPKILAKKLLPNIRHTPKTQRNKKNDEPKNPYKLARNQSKVRCTRCKKLGHNVRTCGGKTGADREIPKGGNKKNKKIVHPTDKTKRASAAGMPPKYKPASKRKRKAPSQPTELQPAHSQPPPSQPPSSQPPSSQPPSSQTSVQASTVTSSAPTTRAKKRARDVVSTQESTL